MDVEANDVAVCIVGTPVHRDADAIDILGELITRRDISFHGDASKGRLWIDWEDAVLGVDILENLLQEVMDEWLDGIVSDGIGRVMDVDTDEGIIQGVHMIIHGEDTMHEDRLGIWQRGWQASIRRRASIRSIAHHHGQLASIHRNQYGVYVKR